MKWRALTAIFHPMAVIGIGVDVVYVDRVGRAVERWGERFLRRVFTPEERRLAERSPWPMETLAARFAAKEAFLKALGTGMFSIPFSEIEVLRDGQGRPYIALRGRAREAAEGVTRIHLSLSHDGGIAVAFCLLEGEG